jgi:hypothetical protein
MGVFEPSKPKGSSRLGELKPFLKVGSTLELGFGFAALPFALDPFAATEAIK